MVEPLKTFNGLLSHGGVDIDSTEIRTLSSYEKLEQDAQIVRAQLIRRRQNMGQLRVVEPTKISRLMHRQT
jgi:hypothetical protein